MSSPKRVMMRGLNSEFITQRESRSPVHPLYLERNYLAVGVIPSLLVITLIIQWNRLALLADRETVAKGQLYSTRIGGFRVQRVRMEALQRPDR